MYLLVCTCLHAYQPIRVSNNGQFLANTPKQVYCSLKGNRFWKTIWQDKTNFSLTISGFNTSKPPAASMLQYETRISHIQTLMKLLISYKSTKK